MSLKEIVKKSKVNKVKLKHGGETFEFNLHEEVSISPSKIQRELQDQPGYYGFLLLLRSRLLTIKEDREREKDKIHSSIYLKACDQINPKTNRPYSDKAAVHKATSSKGYNDAAEKFIKAKHEYNIINSCVMAFEQRSSLLQTLAANIRKEN